MSEHSRQPCLVPFCYGGGYGKPGDFVVCPGHWFHLRGNTKPHSDAADIILDLVVADLTFGPYEQGADGRARLKANIRKAKERAAA